MWGAEVIAVKGNFDDALRLVRVLTEQYHYLGQLLKPLQAGGQKTAAFGIVDVLGDAPDYLAIPVGSTGNISAYWQGFKEYKAKNSVAACRGCWDFRLRGQHL